MTMMYYKIDNVLYMRYSDYYKDLMIVVQELVDQDKMNEVDDLINSDKSGYKVITE